MIGVSTGHVLVLGIMQSDGRRREFQGRELVT